MKRSDPRALVKDQAYWQKEVELAAHSRTAMERLAKQQPYDFFHVAPSVYDLNIQRERAALQHKRQQRERKQAAI